MRNGKPPIDMVRNPIFTPGIASAPPCIATRLRDKGRIAKYQFTPAPAPARSSSTKGA